MTNARTCLGWLATSCIATLICLSFFIAFPGFDLAVSGVFGTSRGFGIRNMAGWNAVRALMITLTDGLIAMATVMLLVNMVVPRWRVIRTRALFFCIAAYALGPGLLVNGFLKSYSQRARPWNIVEFGGNALYSRPFVLAGQCGGHCSFVSGEASALSTIAIITLLVFVPCLPQSRQGRAQAVIVAVAVSGSLLRVAFGAHFLSDVIFAGLFMALLVPSLYLAFGLHRLPGPMVLQPGGASILPVPSRLDPVRGGRTRKPRSSAPAVTCAA